MVDFFAEAGKTATVSNSSRRKTDASLQGRAARAAVIGRRPQLGIVQNPATPARDPWRVPLPHQGRAQPDRTRRARDRDRPRRITPPLLALRLRPALACACAQALSLRSPPRSPRSPRRPPPWRGGATSAAPS